MPSNATLPISRRIVAPPESSLENVDVFGKLVRRDDVAAVLDELPVDFAKALRNVHDDEGLKKVTTELTPDAAADAGKTATAKRLAASCLSNVLLALLLTDFDEATSALDWLITAPAERLPSEPSSLTWISDACNVLRASTDEAGVEKLATEAAASGAVAAKFVRHAVGWVPRLYELDQHERAWRLLGFVRMALPKVAARDDRHLRHCRTLSLYTGIMLLDFAVGRGDIDLAAQARTHFALLPRSPLATALRERAEFLRIRRLPGGAHDRILGFATRCSTLLSRADALAWLINLPTVGDEPARTIEERTEWFRCARELYEVIDDDHLSKARIAVAMHALVLRGIHDGGGVQSELAAPVCDGELLHVRAVALADSVSDKHLQRTLPNTEQFLEYIWACDVVRKSTYALDLSPATPE